MTIFSQLLNKLEMIDMPIGNQNFTWSNMQSIPMLAKVDCFLMSMEQDHAFPLSKVVVMPQIMSNCTPLLLSTSEKKPSHGFRFEEVWLSWQNITKRMLTWWSKVPRQHMSILTSMAKLRDYRKRIKEWCLSNFHNISKTKKELSEEIQKLDLWVETCSHIPLQLEKRNPLKKQLLSTMADEEIP